MLPKQTLNFDTPDTVIPYEIDGTTMKNPSAKRLRVTADMKSDYLKRVGSSLTQARYLAELFDFPAACGLV